MLADYTSLIIYNAANIGPLNNSAPIYVLQLNKFLKSTTCTLVKCMEYRYIHVTGYYGKNNLDTW